ncbi:MAG: serine/threonine-protein kinase [Archangium sp.]|nr:serine/threonine-protein kinase [Archangium sp.]
MPCVETPQWLALTDGRLSADEELAIRGHATTCTTCAPQLAIIDQKRRLAREAPTQELSATQLPRPVEPAPVLERGTAVGRFVVIDTVGMGGMGAVYSAYDPDLDRRVALKTLHTTGTSDPTAHGRMLREAQAMARLSHPNVVNVFDVGEHRGGIFIAMEFVPGVTLRTWERAKERSWREVVALFLQAGRGLAAAHAAHLVHRDFKPANVLLGEDGRARVTDFGVARADGSIEPVGPMIPSAMGEDSGRLNSNSFSEPLTRGDMVVGTVGYMSPEQAEAKTPDARSDQFSFCICLWEGLYGKRPFLGTSVAEVTKALLHGPLPPRPRGTKVPAWLHAVLIRGLERDPDKRYPSMEALLQDLDRAPDEWRRKALPWAAVAAVLLSVGGLQLFSQARERGRCEAVGGELTGVWDDALRAQLATAFGKVTRPFSAAALASAERALDTHAKEWTSAATQSCEQAWVRKELPEADYRLEAACLAQRKRELAAVVTVLATADEGVVERAGTLAWSLPPVRGCTQLARLKSDPRLLAAGGDEARVSALQASLARARSLIDAGKLTDAAPVIEQALASAKELNRRALEAEALSLLGGMHQAAGKFADSADAWTRAVMAAQASGFDELLALAAVRLTTVVGFHLNRPADGRLWDSIARATIERMGGDDVLSLERMAAVARLGNAEGKPMEAAAQHLQALALATTLLGADHPLLWKIEFDLGSSLVAAKDPQAAFPHLERALQLREKEVSGDHPEAAMVRSTLANAYFFAGRVADSRDAFSRALATREKLFGADSPRLIVTLNNFGDTLSKVGRHEEAAAMVARAAVIAKKAYPAGHPYIVATTLTQAEILLAMARREEARAAVESVLAMQPPPTAPYLAEAGAVRAFIALGDGKPKDALAFAMKAVEAGKQVGERSPELVLPLLARGESELALQDPAAAMTTLAQAVVLVDETKPWRVYTADARFALARAKTAAKVEPLVAKQLATEALELYRASEGQEPKAGTVEFFLNGK